MPGKPKSSAERMKALRKRRAETDPNYKEKESRRIADLQKKQRAAMSEEELKQLKEKTTFLMNFMKLLL